jgi:hypothetical protein
MFMMFSEFVTRNSSLINRFLVVYTLIDGDGGEEKSEESKHSAEDYSTRSGQIHGEFQLLGNVKEPPLIFVLRQLWLQHQVVLEVEEKNDITAKEEEEMEDAMVVALAPHEEPNFNVPLHAIEEFMQQQQVEDAPVGVVEADVAEAEVECAID